MSPEEQGNFSAGLVAAGLAVSCLGTWIAYGLGVAVITAGCIFVVMGVAGVYVSKRRRENVQ